MAPELSREELIAYVWRFGATRAGDGEAEFLVAHHAWIGDGTPVDYSSLDYAPLDRAPVDYARANYGRRERVQIDHRALDDKRPDRVPVDHGPSGQAPTGQAPPGQAPPGQAPRGQAPRGQAPRDRKSLDESQLRMLDRFVGLVVVAPVLDSAGAARWERALAPLLGAWALHDSAAYWKRVGPLLFHPAHRRVALAACAYAGGREGIAFLGRLIRERRRCHAEERAMLPAAIACLPQPARHTFLCDLRAWTPLCEAAVHEGIDLQMRRMAERGDVPTPGTLAAAWAVDPVWTVRPARTLYFWMPWILEILQLLVIWLLPPRLNASVGGFASLAMMLQPVVGMLAPLLARLLRVEPRWQHAAASFAWGSFSIIWVPIAFFFLAIMLAFMMALVAAALHW